MERKHDCDGDTRVKFVRSRFVRERFRPTLSDYDRL